MYYCFCQSFVSCLSPFLQKHTRKRSYRSNILANSGITPLYHFWQGSVTQLGWNIPTKRAAPMAFHSARKFCVDEMWTDNVRKINEQHL